MFIFINTYAIDRAIAWNEMSAEEYCKKIDYDYNTFKRVYDSDMTLTLDEILKFAHTFSINIAELFQFI